PEGPVSVRLPRRRAAAEDGAIDFLVATPDGAPLLEASARLRDLSTERSNLRRTTASIALALFAVTILLLAGPLLDRRAAAPAPGPELRLTTAIVAVIVAAGAPGGPGVRLRPWAHAVGARSAARLCLWSATAAGVAAALASAAVRMRLALREGRGNPTDAPLAFSAVQIACGVLLAALLVMFERVLGRSIDPA